MNHTKATAGQANQHGPAARMERSEIRDRRVRADRFPDCAALHPGYEILRCLTGKTRQQSSGEMSRENAEVCLR